MLKKTGEVAKFLLRGMVVLMAFFIITIYSISLFFYVLNSADAASDDDIIDVNLEIAGTISCSCTDSVTMGAITGTGQSALTTNEAICSVVTSNSTGYELTFSSATTYLENANSDQVAAYTPTVAGTPEAWSVATGASEWGARLKKSGSTVYDNKWGAAAGSENYAAADVYWHNVTSSGSFKVVSNNNDTTGDTEIIQFGAEVGSSKFQPTGTYDVDVTMTATTI